MSHEFNSPLNVILNGFDCIAINDWAISPNKFLDLAVVHVNVIVG